MNSIPKVRCSTVLFAVVVLAMVSGTAAAQQWSDTNSPAPGTIYRTGYVGIGTGSSNPQQQLDVFGRIRMTSPAIDPGNSTKPIGEFFGGTSGLIFAFHVVTRSDHPLSFSTGSKAPQMVLWTNGNFSVGSGFTSAPAAKFTVNGNTHVSGDVTVTGNIAAKYQDLAEWVPATSHLQPGTVVVLNPNKSNEVMGSSRPYDTMVAGVVSTMPGIILGEPTASSAQIATTGRVMVKVDATDRPIRVGDLLVTGEQTGMAMASVPVELGGVAVHRPGTILGKALEPLDSGTGEILVLLSLQ